MNKTNTVGLPKGLATALDEINSTMTKVKFRTVDEIYNTMVQNGSIFLNVPKDPRIKWMYGRARARYEKNFPKQYKYNTVEDMVQYLKTNHIENLLNLCGKNIERIAMAEEAHKIHLSTGQSEK